MSFIFVLMTVTTKKLQPPPTARLGIKLLPTHKMIEPTTATISTFMFVIHNLTMAGMHFGQQESYKYGTAKLRLLIMNLVTFNHPLKMYSMR